MVSDGTQDNSTGTVCCFLFSAQRCSHDGLSIKRPNDVLALSEDTEGRERCLENHRIRRADEFYSDSKSGREVSLLRRRTHMLYSVIRCCHKKEVVQTARLSAHFVSEVNDQSLQGVGGTVASESAETLLSRVRAPPPASWPDGGPESHRSPCCGLAI
ncbi:hypothetical protein PoB_007305200 [Plakobranchus ocellatus]|uniref:Uncharacterized protein n=1 Tax=Plakobranchus ocellatus TaxID=259542 RepID=A0AAV4DQE8_9GAST|nr:hypothetical protein PoB_007305200 [Plakobranchus ocellatus]